MQYRPLGSTGIQVSALSFGAGPVSGLMTGPEGARQVEVVARAIERGLNWFDTAATYGGGTSESHLGAALRELDARERVHVATKVRLLPEQLGAIGPAVRESFAGSLERLGLERVTLLQLHNSVTARRGDEPTSITPEDVLGPGGVLEAMQALRAEGRVAHLGLTGIGQPNAMRRVVRSGSFATMQIPYHLLNPSAARTMPPGFTDTDYGNLIGDCAACGMGVFAIRVLAGGALAGNPPSAHTLKTPFFPLDLYRRDQERARRVGQALGGQVGVTEAAVRFVLGDVRVSSAIVGFGEPGHVDEAVRWLGAGPLPSGLLEAVESVGYDAV